MGENNSHNLRWFGIGVTAMYALVRWTRGVATRAGVRKDYTEEDNKKIKDQLRKEWKLK